MWALIYLPNNIFLISLEINSKTPIIKAGMLLAFTHLVSPNQSENKIRPVKIHTKVLVVATHSII